MYAGSLYYLYVRSFYLKQVKAEGNELAGNASTQQSSTANTYIKLAKQLMESVKSQAQYSEEMGMFWKKQGRGYYWYESLI